MHLHTMPHLNTMKRTGLLVLGTLLLSGCGGGSGHGPGAGGEGGGGGLGLVHYMAIASTEVRDGYISSVGTVFTAGPGAFVGDDPADSANRAVLSFNLNEIPAGAQIQSVSLMLKSEAIIGEFSGHVELVVAHCDFGPFIDAIDFGTAPRTPGLIHAGPTISMQNLDYDVTTRVQQDLADGRTWSDFRVRFMVLTDNDGQWDGQTVRMRGPGPMSDHTHLLIGYTMP